MNPTMWCALHERHLNVDERGEETKLLGFYSSLSRAQHALAFLGTQPGFSDDPAGLRIVAVPINVLIPAPIFYQSDEWDDPDPLAGTRSVDYLDYADMAAMHGGKIIAALFKQVNIKKGQSELSLLGIFTDYHSAAAQVEATVSLKAIEIIQIFYELDQLLWSEGFVTEHY